jgi:hypothetical protein
MNFNDASGGQRSFDLIPAGTVVILQMNIRPGGAGSDGDAGWLRLAADGNSEAVDCEFTVVSPPEYAKRKLWALLTVAGIAPGHAEAARISRELLCAILESARGVLPKDLSEAAQAARNVDWNAFQYLRFVARLGVKPAQGQYPAKNIILEAITPDRKAWTQPEQLPLDPTAPKPQTGNGAAPESTTAPAAAAAQSNASIARPKWAAD